MEKALNSSLDFSCFFFFFQNTAIAFLTFSLQRKKDEEQNGNSKIKLDQV